MALRRKILGGGGVLMAGQVLGQTCSFGRNVVLARLLATEDFGIAATFALAVSMLEMISNLAVDRMLVQAEDGDEPSFQATAHTFQALRGAVLALLLFLLAWPFSRLFEIPEALWAFQCIALVPLIRGFVHLDSKRMQREFKYRSDILIDLISQAILLIAAWPFVWWFHDYAAMVWLLVFQVIVMVVSSHLLAVRPYEWGWDRSAFIRMYTFGWPLLFNGVIMFLILQGDRFVIGSMYDMTQLGIYTAAFTITFVPSTMLAKVSSAVMLPLLSKELDDLHRFSEFYVLSICVLSIIGVLVATAFILFGAQVVVLTYGAKYAGVASYIGLLATMQMIRVLRVGPTIACMASGDTKGPLTANFGRIAVFPMAIWMASLGKPISWIVVIGCIGELLALAAMVRRLRHSQGLLYEHTVKPSLIGTASIAIAIGVVSTNGDQHSWRLFAVTMLVVSGGALGAMFAFIAPWRNCVAQLLRGNAPKVRV